MNQLAHSKEFQEVLADLKLSDEARLTIEGIGRRFALLVGPSSSGKNTIINELVKTGHYHSIVSDTTRKPRVNNGVPEQNGREYWFRTEEEVLADLKAGKFLEAAIIHGQQVSGISIRELERAAKADKVALNEIEVVGADHVHRLAPSAQFLFMVPPGFDELITRMNARGELPADETRRRLGSAAMEVDAALSRGYYTFVVNGTVEHTTAHVDQIIREGRVDTPEEQAYAHGVAQQLLADTQHFLANLE